MLRQKPGKAPLGQGPVSAAFSWSGACLAAVRAVHGREALEASLCGRSIKLSTHCSGVGSPELAAQQLEASSMSALGFQLDLKFVSACEKNRSCQKILCRRTGAGHIFTDMFQYFPNWDQRMRTPSESYAILRAGCEPQRSRFCHLHQGHCQGPSVDVDLCGSPCQPWSKYGLRKGFRALCL